MKLPYRSQSLFLTYHFYTNLAKAEIPQFFTSLMIYLTFDIIFYYLFIYFIL